MAIQGVIFATPVYRIVSVIDDIPAKDVILRGIGIDVVPGSQIDQITAVAVIDRVIASPGIDNVRGGRPGDYVIPVPCFDAFEIEKRLVAWRGVIEVVSSPVTRFTV